VAGIQEKGLMVVQGWGFRQLLILLMVVLVSSCSKPKLEERKTGTSTGDTTVLAPPTADDRIRLRVTYPENGQPKPNVDSNFIFGSTGVTGSTKRRLARLLTDAC
jgi:hypothetical protein